MIDTNFENIYEPRLMIGKSLHKIILSKPNEIVNTENFKMFLQKFIYFNPRSNEYVPYVLCQPLASKFCLISLWNFNRWHEPRPILELARRLESRQDNFICVCEFNRDLLMMDFKLKLEDL